jgi:Acyl-CoA carboxylase epsilon subunit
MNENRDPGGPRLRVMSGDATPEELAALVAAIGSRTAARRTGPQERPTGWNDRARALRCTLPHGPGAWAASGLPR